MKGSEYLRDVVIDSAQVLPLAKGIFAGLNIRVEDERDDDHCVPERDASLTSPNRRA
jgi:hypothetical protein